MVKKLDKDCGSFRLFLDAIKSDKTKKTYVKAIDHFMRSQRLNDYDKVAKAKTDTVQKWLEDWVRSQKNEGLKHNTITGRLNGVELFLDMNKRVWYRKIVRKMLPSNDEIPGGKIPFTTEESFKLRQACRKPRDYALLDFLASTGIRPAAIEDPVLRLRQLVEMPHNCYAIKVYDGSKEGYWAFLIPEARKSLDDYLSSRKRNGENLTQDSPLFANYETAPKTEDEHLSVYSIRRTLERLIKTAGIKRVKTGNRYDKAIVYGFRKRFNGILKINNEVNSNIAEKLMAHKNGLDGHYLEPTREECFKEFYKAVHELTIDPTERQEIEIRDQKEKITELEQKEDEIKWLLLKQKETEEAIHEIMKGVSNGTMKIVSEYKAEQVKPTK